MSNAEKVFALTELLGDVMHTLEMKQYVIEDPTESHKCETEADEYRSQMFDILVSNKTSGRCTTRRAVLRFSV